MNNLIDALKADWQTFIGYAPRILLALAVLIAFYLVGKYFAKLLSSILRRAALREIHENFIKILALAISLFIGLVVALNILGLEKLAVSVLAGGGVTAIVLGFAFREIGENFLAGMFLAFSRPFKTGDAIKTEDIEGKVQDIALRYTHLRTDDGRDIYVPSSQLFNKPVTNFTKDGLRRISFTIGVDYSDNAKLACKLLFENIKHIDGVLMEPEPGAYIIALAPQYVEIQVFFWVDVFNTSIQVLSVRTDVLDACRQTLLQNGFTLSSDTTTNIAIIENKSS